MRVIAIHRHDLGDLPILAEHDARFGGIEVHCAVGLAGFPQRVVKPVQTREVRHQISITSFLLGLHSLLQFGFGRLHDIGDFVISESAVGMNHRLVELIGSHLPQRRNLHLAHQCEPVYLRL